MLRIGLVSVLVLLNAGIANISQGESLHQWPQFDRILILPDTSGSLDGQEYEIALSALAHQLVEIAGATRSTRIGLLPWAGSSDAMRSAHWVTIPHKRDVEVMPVRFTEGESIFRASRELKKEREEERARARNAEAEREHQENITRALVGFRVRLLSAKQGVSECTDVRGILRRCERELPNTLILIVSDLEDQCLTRSGAEAGLSRGSRAVVIVIPSKRTGPADQPNMHERMSWCRRHAPWARPLFSFEISASAEQWLLPRLTDHMAPAERSVSSLAK